MTGAGDRGAAAGASGGAASGVSGASAAGLGLGNARSLGLGAHFVYQRVRVEEGRVARLDDHLRLAERALKSVYGIDTQLDRPAVAALIAAAARGTGLASSAALTGRGSGLAAGGSGSAALAGRGSGSATGARAALAMLIFEPDRPPRVEIERPLLVRGYGHSPLRPVGVTHCYSVPYAGWPTSVGLAATALLDDLAGRAVAAETAAALAAETGGADAGRATFTSRNSGASARSIRREGDRLIAAGDAALFGIRGRRIFTAPIEDGAMESVERQAVMDAVRARNSRLELIEEAVPHSRLRDFDELFLADAAGIISLSECDGAKFSALSAENLIESGKLKIENELRKTVTR